MIKHLDSINIKKYKCKKQISSWLQKEQGIPLLGFEGEFFYFIDNDQLRMALLKLPFWLRVYAS